MNECRYSLITEDSSTAQVDQNSIIAAAVVSSVVISAVVFFLLGCACGWLGHKYKGTINKTKSDKNANSEPAPLYEDLQSTSIQSQTDQGKAFELKENVAYGPVRLT
jgi:lipopolysaccharide export LptBFGC system permease protein LptF